MKAAGGSRPAAPRPEGDFREQAIKDALDKSVRAYRPETSRHSRLKRIAVVAVLTLAAVAAFWAALHLSTPKPAPGAADRKPIRVELLPAR